jgi:hypothetical protein
MWRYLSHFAKLDAAIEEYHVDGSPLAIKADGALAPPMAFEWFIMPAGQAADLLEPDALDGSHPNK